LIPKSHKNFIKPTAKELNVDEILVSDVVGFYYSELRKSLNDIASINIKVDSLGTFSIKSKELYKLKGRLTGHLKALENPETFNQMRIKKDIEEKFEKVTNAANLLGSEKLRKQEVKKNRNEKT
jgi:hypothetical protein